MDSNNSGNSEKRSCCRLPQKDNIDTSTHYSCHKLNTYDWLKDMPLGDSFDSFDCVEIRFKNDRKEFFRLDDKLEIKSGDYVAVEASPGHDIGIVSLTGPMALMQMRKKRLDPKNEQIKKVYRIAKSTDLEKWENSTAREDETKKRTRQIVMDLKLGMKINDVEFQGDGTKAIFFYTAEERVDFRELIKILAETFQIRIEMKQIGSRQEASKLGGTGPCGRELCCSTWLTDFKSVSTSTARTQQLSLNPQKLAGQCGKLKCCINFEQDFYNEAHKRFPKSNQGLKFEEGEAYQLKVDFIQEIIWFGLPNKPGNYYPISLSNVQKIMKMNEQGKKAKNISTFIEQLGEKDIYENVMGEDDFKRFDK